MNYRYRCTGSAVRVTVERTRLGLSRGCITTSGSPNKAPTCHDLSMLGPGLVCHLALNQRSLGSREREAPGSLELQGSTVPSKLDVSSLHRPCRLDNKSSTVIIKRASHHLFRPPSLPSSMCMSANCAAASSPKRIACAVGHRQNGAPMATHPSIPTVAQTAQSKHGSVLWFVASERAL